MKTLRVHYEGRVQGVGFRYTSEDADRRRAGNQRRKSCANSGEREQIADSTPGRHFEGFDDLSFGRCVGDSDSHLDHRSDSARFTKASTNVFAMCSKAGPAIFSIRRLES
jgi:hypothetical protein